MVGHRQLKNINRVPGTDRLVGRHGDITGESNVYTVHVSRAVGSERTERIR